MTRGATPKMQKNSLDAITSGYIMIPFKVDRDSYIDTCFRTNLVCVLFEGGLFKTDVYITNEAIQNIHFPTKAGEKGTQVIVASGAFRSQPIVIGTIPGNDETQYWSEDIIRFRKTVKGTTMTMVIDPKNNEWNFNTTSNEPTNFNIRCTGNESSKILLHTEGELEAQVQKKARLVGYDTIETEIVNAKVEAKEPGKEVRKITYDLEKLKIVRKMDDQTSEVTWDDQKIDIAFHNRKEFITIDDNNVIFSFGDGQEKVTLSQNLIKMITGNKVEINGASEPLTLANTLIQLLNNVENQITTLKQAWSTAAAAAVPGTDGGKAGLSAGSMAVASISPLNFDGVKSKVIFSD